MKGSMGRINDGPVSRQHFFIQTGCNCAASAQIAPPWSIQYRATSVLSLANGIKLVPIALLQLNWSQS